jgi:transcriptional regulator with XRE-family HTH domain
MTEDLAEETGPPQVGGIGAQLRAAREALGLTLEHVATETRIPQRHLQTIEAGEFSALPARTYAIGFARTYAKAVGLDHDDVADLVRAELDAQEFGPRHRVAGFEPGDPARVPSRTLGWLSVLAVVLVLAGLFFAARTFFAPAAELPSLIEQEEAEQAAREAAQQRSVPTAATAATASGAVVFTALADRVWVKFYDASGAQLMQKEMARGETYTVPTDAEGPQLWTGRPDALAITVGGRAVPRLAEEERVVRDVPVTAQALLTRGRAAATPAPSPTT